MRLGCIAASRAQFFDRLIGESGYLPLTMHRSFLEPSRSAPRPAEVVTSRRFCHNAAITAAVQGGDPGSLEVQRIGRELERGGFVLVKEKGSIRYYAKTGWPNLIRIDYHGSKEVPTGTCHSILKAAGIRKT
ncbi:MAG TPA: type II toxin-antitoxin system HicA family toxin [Thermoanaerobaculia bacterium]